MIKRFYPELNQEPTLTIVQGSSAAIFTFQGDMFDYITGNGLYLSANVINPILSSYNFYSNIKSISAKFPAFTGYPITNYEILNNNILRFRMPSVYLGNCKIDFVFANEAGYGLASQSSRFTYVQMISTGENVSVLTYLFNYLTYTGSNLAYNP